MFVGPRVDQRTLSELLCSIAPSSVAPKKYCRKAWISFIVHSLLPFCFICLLPCRWAYCLGHVPLGFYFQVFPWGGLSWMEAFNILILRFFFLAPSGAETPVGPLRCLLPSAQKLGHTGHRRRIVLKRNHGKWNLEAVLFWSQNLYRFLMIHTFSWVLRKPLICVNLSFFWAKINLDFTKLLFNLLFLERRRGSESSFLLEHSHIPSV